MSVDVEPTPQRRGRAERFLATVAPFWDIVFVSHVNPDPDALASMLGLQALINAKLPGKRTTLTMDGMIARAENQAMVDLIPVPIIPRGPGSDHRADGTRDGRYPASHRSACQ